MTLTKNRKFKNSNPTKFFSCTCLYCLTVAHKREILMNKLFTKNKINKWNKKATTSNQKEKMPIKLLLIKHKIEVDI